MNFPLIETETQFQQTIDETLSRIAALSAAARTLNLTTAQQQRVCNAYEELKEVEFVQLHGERT